MRSPLGHQSASARYQDMDSSRSCRPSSTAPRCASRGCQLAGTAHGQLQLSVRILSPESDELCSTQARPCVCMLPVATRLVRRKLLCSVQAAGHGAAPGHHSLARATRLASSGRPSAASQGSASAGALDVRAELSGGPVTATPGQPSIFHVLLGHLRLTVSQVVAYHI